MTNSADPVQKPADLDLQIAKTGQVIFSKKRVKSVGLAPFLKHQGFQAYETS